MANALNLRLYVFQCFLNCSGLLLASVKEEGTKDRKTEDDKHHPIESYY